ncbi:MAG: hypothetical protein AN484_00620 [Aphanizomenon flos-aquae WA102]|uniref:Uncharacterized protein n=1 Tax=Aphanizomenon flos-aquae WA102 TaxID=1710896 RepID=A0A1B7X828_APHFL|nr:MAG: hypothetical protein AN484_00620 [Aphanizomenon flos-aquae WA102]
MTSWNQNRQLMLIELTLVQVEHLIVQQHQLLLNCQQVLHQQPLTQYLQHLLQLAQEETVQLEQL